jgi:hypothetical protein
MTPAQQAETYAQQKAGTPYQLGGVGPNVYDCSGFISDLYAIMTGKPYTGSERYFSTENNCPPPGFVAGYKPGAFNIGVSHGGPGGGHMAATLPSGVNVEAGGANDAVTYGGNAKGARDFKEIYHLDVGTPTTTTVGTPGATPATPAYVTPAKPAQTGSGAEQFGQDLVSGFMEIFGLGDLFKDPTQFGLFKIFKALMGVKVGDSSSTSPSTSSLGAPGGDGGGGLIDSLMGIIPQPFGPLNVAGQPDAPGEFLPSADGGGGLADFMTQFIPPGQPQQGNVDNSVTVQGNNIGYSETAVKDQVQGAQMEAARPRLRPLP